MSKSKVVSADEALADLRDGMQIATGGWIFASQPMALVRAVIRKGVKNLRLVAAPGSIAPDMLIGAGCVSEVSCAFISFGQFGLSPQFRRAAESGEIKINELDGPGLAAGLRAGACDLPYMLIPDLGTDLPRVNPDSYRSVPRTRGERPLLMVPAIQPDFALLHGQQADEQGNVQLFGGCFFDPMLAQASKKVVVCVDRIVDTATIRKDGRLTKLPAAFVHAVIEAPFGAHPSSSAARYEVDENHIGQYVKASSDPKAYRTYLERYVIQPTGQDEYVDLIGRDRLSSLETARPSA
jgi:glutaconate CoA-transferase subunit A